MYCFPIGKEYKYDFNEPKFRTAFEFLKRKDLADLPVGWVDLENGVRASIQHYTTFDWDANEFETHEDYFDVQYLVEGIEYVGVCLREGLEVSKPYDKKAEITFYKEPSVSGKVLLRAGDFVVLAPEDAHKPRCAAGRKIPVIKIVVKVPVR